MTHPVQILAGYVVNFVLLPPDGDRPGSAQAMEMAGIIPTSSSVRGRRQQRAGLIFPSWGQINRREADCARSCRIHARPHDARK
jgi:hypothetical protein